MHAPGCRRPGGACTGDDTGIQFGSRQLTSDKDCMNIQSSTETNLKQDYREFYQPETDRMPGWLRWVWLWC